MVVILGNCLQLVLVSSLNVSPLNVGITSKMIHHRGASLSE